jgi:hypothetical protein
MTSEASRKYIRSRSMNPAWVLLASRRAPLVLSCLKPLFEDAGGDIAWEDAVEKLALIFGEHANAEEYAIPAGERIQAARAELRDWIRRGLVVEREGRLLQTHSLQNAFHFLDSLDEEIMTSTASRLATVQREIEGLAAKLNPILADRSAHLKRQIVDLEAELAKVERGEFEVLSGPKANEGIREVYKLAVSLRSDFRRVEDSFRNADHQLRQEIVRSDQNRGSVLDLMLDGHEELLQTPEGQVFDGFYAQLNEQVELDQMKSQLRSILENSSATEALNRKQIAELRWLVPGLVSESERVIQARARGERDVRGFIKAGLAGEHHRVGAILNELLELATELDWTSASLRRSPSPLPPVAVGVYSLPLAQRLRFKEPSDGSRDEMNLSEQNASLEEVGQDFWDALDGLDRLALFQNTRECLQASECGLTLGDLARALPPTHDLETVTYWLSLGRETGADFGEEREDFVITDRLGTLTRFEVPKIVLNGSAVGEVEPEVLG